MLRDGEVTSFSTSRASYQKILARGWHLETTASPTQVWGGICVHFQQAPYVILTPSHYKYRNDVFFKASSNTDITQLDFSPNLKQKK